MGEKETGKGKTFPYTKETCRCQNCMYHKKGRCFLQTCCCIDRHVNTHTCTFAQAMRACFIDVKNPIFRYRLRLVMERVKERGSCFLGKEHERRFYKGLVRANRKDKELTAQIYLLSAAETLWKWGKRCIYAGGICYAGVDMRGAAPEDKVLFYTAMNFGYLSMVNAEDLSEEDVAFNVFCAVCCAVCICTYGIVFERRRGKDSGKSRKSMTDKYLYCFYIYNIRQRIRCNCESRKRV